MGLDRSKKRIQLWKKAAIHFALCFVMGFFTGFAPTSTASLFSSQANPYRSISNLGISAQPAQSRVPERKPSSSADNNRSLMSDVSSSSVEDRVPARDNVLIVVTTARPGERFVIPLLQRLGHTLRLVPSPLLWIVVEAHSDAPRTAEVLRRTGIMYRHLTYKENFTDPKAEADHQRNVALNHVEYHRLNGILHFADVSTVYDLEFFQQIREIEVFGAWPLVMVSANRRRVMVEGPVCSSAKVVGWQSKDLSGDASSDSRTAVFGRESTGNDTAETKPAARINISGFAFNSSILWDPERWGRPSSVLDTSQDSIKFVQEVVLEDETKLKGIPSDCSKIMLWHLHVPRTLTTQTSSQYQNKG